MLPGIIRTPVGRKTVSVTGPPKNSNVATGQAFVNTNRDLVLPNNAYIVSMGIYDDTGAAFNCSYKILKRASPGSYDVFFNRTAVSHPATGWFDISVGVTIPASGTYQLAGYFPIKPADTFGTAVNRAFGITDITGNGNALTEDVNAVIMTRATYML